MIPFNVFGHTKRAGGDENIPIVWVDAQDTGSYTLSGNDVTALFNKGSLGGAMTLNGTVKFANSGFESWSGLDYITRDLGEPFLTNNSFTIATTFDLQDITSGTRTDRNWFTQLWSDVDNIIVHYRTNTTQLGQAFVYASNVGNLFNTYQLGVNTIITSYDVNSGNVTMLNFDGVNSTFVSVGFNNTVNSVVQLLSADGYTNSNSGANNPLHEFRLYDRAFSLTEMQNLQTELNNKYIQLGSELVTNGDFSNGSTDWILINAICNNGYFEYGVSTGTSSIRQNVFIVGKKYRLKFEVLNYVSGLVGLSSQVTGTGYYPNNVGAFEIEIEPIQSDLVMLGTVDGFTIDNVSVKEIL